MQLTFVTSNDEKVKEAQAILGFPIEIKKVDLDEIQHTDITEVVKQKAKDAYAIVQSPVIVDDVGFYVDVWNGFPGPFVKFLRQNDTNDLLLYLMRQETNRKIKAVSAIGFYDGERAEAFIGEMEGELTTEERGKGWGFDPIIIPLGYTQTVGELGEEVKNKISHRKLSLEKFKEFLKDYSQLKTQ